MKKTFYIVIGLSALLIGVSVLAQTPGTDSSELLPASVTSSEGEQGAQVSAINTITLDARYYADGSTSTILSEIENPVAVEDFTLDIPNIAKVRFAEPIDISRKEAVDLVGHIQKYVTLETSRVTLGKELWEMFNVPVEITYYNVPFVWDPNIIHDGNLVGKEAVLSFKRKTVNDKEVVSFIIDAPGVYELIPQITLYIENDAVVTKKEYAIRGRISHPSAELSLRVNSIEVNSALITKNATTGEFEAPIELTEGANLIEAIAKSDYGNVQTINRIIQYRGTNVPAQTEKEGISPLYFLAGALIVVMLILLVVSKLSRRR